MSRSKPTRRKCWFGLIGCLLGIVFDNIMSRPIYCLMAPVLPRSSCIKHLWIWSGFKSTLCMLLYRALWRQLSSISVWTGCCLELIRKGICVTSLLHVVTIVRIICTHSLTNTLYCLTKAMSQNRVDRSQLVHTSL